MSIAAAVTGRAWIKLSVLRCIVLLTADIALKDGNAMSGNHQRVTRRLAAYRVRLRMMNARRLSGNPGLEAVEVKIENGRGEKGQAVLRKGARRYR